MEFLAWIYVFYCDLILRTHDHCCQQPLLVFTCMKPVNSKPKHKPALLQVEESGIGLTTTGCLCIRPDMSCIYTLRMSRVFYLFLFMFTIDYFGKHKALSLSSRYYWYKILLNLKSMALI